MRSRAKSAANAPAITSDVPVAPAEDGRTLRAVAADHPIALLQTNSLPTLGRSALIACLGVFTIKACVAVAPFVRRLALVRAAKP